MTDKEKRILNARKKNVIESFIIENCDKIPPIHSLERVNINTEFEPINKQIKILHEEDIINGC